MNLVISPCVLTRAHAAGWPTETTIREQCLRRLRLAEPASRGLTYAEAVEDFQTLIEGYRQNIAQRAAENRASVVGHYIVGSNRRDNGHYINLTVSEDGQIRAIDSQNNVTYTSFSEIHSALGVDPDTDALTTIIVR